MNHNIETAPSGRASCKTCGEKIEKGALRFAEAYASGFTGGMAFRYHHLLCAAKKLPYDLSDTLAAFTGDIPDRAALDAALAEAKTKIKPKAAAFPFADRAPTARAKCIVCAEPIAKDSFRVAVEREVDTGGFVSKSAGYMHPPCVTGWLDENLPDADAKKDFSANLRAHSRALNAAELDEVCASLP